MPDVTASSTPGGEKRVMSYNTSRLWSITDESDAVFARAVVRDPGLAAARAHVEATIKTALEPLVA